MGFNISDIALYSINTIRFNGLSRESYNLTYKQISDTQYAIYVEFTRPINATLLYIDIVTPIDNYFDGIDISPKLYELPIEEFIPLTRIF